MRAAWVALAAVLLGIALLALAWWPAARPAGAASFAPALEPIPGAAPFAPALAPIPGRAPFAPALEPVPGAAPGPRRLVEPRREGPFRAPAMPRLDPASEAYARRLDEEIPRRLIGRAAEACAWQGQPAEGKLRVQYLLEVRAGQARVRQVVPERSTLSDETVAACLLQAIAAAGWREPALPDLEEEGELSLRIGALAKHRPAAELEAEDGL